MKKLSLILVILSLAISFVLISQKSKSSKKTESKFIEINSDTNKIFSSTPIQTDLVIPSGQGNKQPMEIEKLAVNTLIVGETNQTFSPINVGNYAVEVTVGSCIEMSNCVAFTTLGVEIPETNYFTILPNSVKSVITIESTLNETFSINIFNVSGQKMLETSSNKNRTDLDLSAYASGIYYVKVKGNKGASTFRVLKD